MKNLARLAVISVAFSTAAFSAPFMAIGDGAEIFVTGMLGARADDNIFLTDNAQSDVIFDINPGAELTFGKGGQLQGKLTLVDAFANYSRNSKLNTNLFSGDFGAKYDDGKLKLGLNAGYHELNQNSVDIHGLTRRDVFTVGGNAEVEISEITSVASGITYTHTNYKRAGYGDSDDYVIPVNFYYKWTPKVELSLGYQFRDYQTTVGQDSTDHYLNVGARGEFTPKLTGQFTVGVTQRRIAHGGDETMLGLDAKFSYELTPKTALQLGASSAPDTAPQGQQQKNFSVYGQIKTDISEQLSLNAGLSYRAIDYLTRTDDYVEGTLGATYLVNNYVNLVGGYVYRHNSSKLSGSVFTNNVFSFAANIRY
jgi:hypothetical protein